MGRRLYVGNLPYEMPSNRDAVRFELLDDRISGPRALQVDRPGG